MGAFERGGFAGPFRACSSQEMRDFNRELNAAVFTCDGPDPRSRHQSRHLDCPQVLRMCTNETIVQAARAILGDGLVLWRTNFFPKPPGAPEFDWHNDRSHWRDLLDPMINVTIWLAVDPATPQAGCLQFTSSSSAGEEPVTMTLEPGEFVVFDQDTLHRSGPNQTQSPRMGLAIRFTLPSVKIKRDERLPQSHRTISL